MQHKTQMALMNATISKLHSRLGSGASLSQTPDYRLSSNHTWALIDFIKLYNKIL